MNLLLDLLVITNATSLRLESCFTRLSRELKWFKPPLRPRIFPFLVTLNLFVNDLFVFIKVFIGFLSIFLRLAR